MKTEEEEGDQEMRLGSPVTCAKCGEVSFYPFYACQQTCPLTISNAEKNQIHDKFEPSHVTCREIRKPCGNKKIRRSDLVNHLKNSHGIRRLTLYPEEEVGEKVTNTGIVHIALPADKLLGKDEFRWPTTTFNFDGLEFLFGAVFNPKDNRGSSVHFWIYSNESEKIAKKFKYSLTLASSLLSKSKKRKWNWTRGVHSWSYYDFNKIRSRRETVPIPVKYLIPICKKQDGKQNQKYFNLEIKMFKNKNGIPTPMP